MKRLQTLVLIAGIALAAGTAAAQERWGSIVFSQESGGGYAWGIAWSYGSHASATSRAIDECRSRGGNHCREIYWFRDACGALAIGDNNGYGAGWGTSTAEAGNQAMIGCRRHNSNCRVEVSRCSE